MLLPISAQRAVAITKQNYTEYEKYWKLLHESSEIRIIWGAKLCCINGDMNRNSYFVMDDEEAGSGALGAIAYDKSHSISRISGRLIIKKKKKR